MSTSRIPEILRKHEAALLDDWTREQNQLGDISHRLSEADLRAQSRRFLQLLQEAATRGDAADTDTEAFREVRRFLEEVSASRAALGFSPSETATFVFSFKQPLFNQIRASLPSAEDQLAEIWTATLLLDKLGLYTMETYQKTRESIIARQQEEMLELSTPVVKLWDGVLALPIIGTLDSSRTQTIMENLLEKIVETGSELAIIDITGVPTVDTLTAQHLLKTVTAARLMGAECIISGIRPQIAQTIVHLGVELGDIITKASLADAFRIAMQRTGHVVVRKAATSRL
ncbi:STAS domain-containing protein [Paracidobacterium acidisoli]|uniref:STAS domain-containing protein n=1 Tax=Paracidobacterium acidisoli TaxID=2303751 RepID=A0A372IT80_9BACT|nr:STAS domain-containing protein [Paracidobacterium acidisoli]